MLSICTHRLAAAAAVAALSFAAASARAAPSWITVGEKAHALLAQVAPQARTLGSQQLKSVALEQRGSRRLVPSSETVYALEVDDAALPALSEAVHDELRKCGGFIRHDSAAEALATLQKLLTLQNTPPTNVAPSYVINDQAAVNALLPQLQASNILSTIQTLSDFQNRRHTSSHGTAASNWLFNAWTQLAPGRRNVRVTQIAHTGFSQKSVMLEIQGTSNSREVVVLGGHLDSTASGNPETVRAPGADDDASGVASLTEVIRVLIANNYQPKRTLRFYAYAGEEAGLLGSKQIVASMPRQRTQVVGVLQLDMTAYQGTATDLWIFTDYTNAAQNQFLGNLASTYLPQYTVGFDACGYGCSDHASWYLGGFAASFPFESSNTQDNPRIHTAGDTIANFGGSANHALKFSRLALTFMVELGSDNR